MRGMMKMEMAKKMEPINSHVTIMSVSNGIAIPNLDCSLFSYRFAFEKLKPFGDEVF
ncbi:hypothetical protein ES703_14515 [subsurface metagenome]